MGRGFYCNGTKVDTYQETSSDFKEITLELLRKKTANPLNLKLHIYKES